MNKFKSTLNIIAALVTLVLMTGTVLAANDDDIAGQLPVDTYTAPEDMVALSPDLDSPNAGDYAARAAALPFRRLRGEEYALRNVDRILQSTGHSLDSSKDVVGESHLLDGRQKPANWVPWHLRQMILNLGVSLQGTVGIVTAIGQATCEIIWSRRPQITRALGIDSSSATPSDQPINVSDDGRKADLTFDDSTTSEELDQLLDPIVSTVMATKRVQNESLMRDGLKSVARDMQTLMANSAYVYNAPWLVQQYRVDVNIQITGKVHPGVSAGGAVRLRFEWTRRANRSFNSNPPTDDAAKNLAQLFQTLGHDFEATNLANGGKFELQAIQVGIGMYLNAKFAVVKGNFGVMGYAMFRRQRQVSLATFDRNAGFNHIPMLENHAPARHFTFAKSNHIGFERSTNFATGTDKALFRVDRERFRKGLAKSASWADKIAERSDRSPSKKWFVSELRPAFSLSIQGATPVVTVGGTAMIEFRMQRSI